MINIASENCYVKIPAAIIGDIGSAKQNIRGRFFIIVLLAVIVKILGCSDDV